MDTTARAFGVTLTGVLLAGVCLLPVKALSLTAAALLVVAIPAWAAARAVCGDGADPAERLAASFGGVSVSCLALWTCGTVLGLSRPLVMASPIAAALMMLVLPGRSGGQRPAKPLGAGQSKALVLFAVGFALIVAIPFLPYGWERSDGVHRMGLSDWYLHLLMTNALDSAPALPPANPLLYSAKSAHYHYGFHLLAAAIHRAAGRQGDIFPILLGLTMLTAAAFPTVLFAVARGLTGSAERALAASAAATFLAGFDLLVWAVRGAANVVTDWPAKPGMAALRTAIPSAHLDFWIDHNERQFNAPYVATIWAPHYVMAVLTALLVVHLLRPDASDASRVRSGRWVEGLMLASLPALSIYVAMTIVAGIAGLAAADVWRAGGRPWHSPALRRWAPVAVIALLGSLPVLVSLGGSASQHLAPLTLHVSSAGSWQNGALFSFFLGDSWWTHLLDTPALYFFEFGIVGVLGATELIRRTRDHRWTAPEREAVSLIVTVMVFLTVVRPPVGGPNNLNFRPMLIAWSLLSVFAVEAWSRSVRHGMAVRLGLALSAAGTVYAIGGATLEGALFWPTPRETVAVARWIDSHTPPHSVVAIHPDDNSRAIGYWLRRRVVLADHRRDAIMLGATPSELDPIDRRLREAFDSRDSVTAARSFADLEADVVLVKVGDRPEPPWARPPCFQLAHEQPPFKVFLRLAEGCRSP